MEEQAPFTRVSGTTVGGPAGCPAQRERSTVKKGNNGGRSRWKRQAGATSNRASLDQAKELE